MAAKPATPTPLKPEDLTIHYPAVERLVATEDFARINKDFTSTYKELEKMSPEGGMGKASKARKAMAALERTMELLRDILKLKYRLAQLHEAKAREQAAKKK